MFTKVIPHTQKVKPATPLVLFEQINADYGFAQSRELADIKGRLKLKIDTYINPQKNKVLFKFSEKYRDNYYQTLQQQTLTLTIELTEFIKLIQAFEIKHQVKVSLLLNPSWTPSQNTSLLQVWRMAASKEELLLAFKKECGDFLDQHGFPKVVYKNNDLAGDLDWPG